MALHIGVIGPGTSRPSSDALGEEVGRRVAEAGAVVVCGGLGGVMAAACKGAAGAGGIALGVLPGEDRREANQWVTVAVPTGLGELRNGLVVRASDALVAIEGEYGTLSELTFALRTGRPVVGLGTWNLVRPDGRQDDAVLRADDPKHAVTLALALAAEQH